MKKMNSTSSQQRNEVRDRGTARPSELEWQQCMLKWGRDPEMPGGGRQEPGSEDEKQVHGLPSGADEGLDALMFCVLYPRMGYSRRSQRASDVVERIRRRYRRRLGPRAKWREYVAGLVGVRAHTVGAWRGGTQRPSPERKAKLLEICRDWGKARR